MGAVFSAFRCLSIWTPIMCGLFYLTYVRPLNSSVFGMEWFQKALYTRVLVA